MCPSQTPIETFSSTNKMLGLKVSFNKCKILESYQGGVFSDYNGIQSGNLPQEKEMILKTTTSLYHTTEQQQQQKVNYCKNKIV